jgi:hypothetical protein
MRLVKLIKFKDERDEPRLIVTGDKHFLMWLVDTYP